MAQGYTFDPALVGAVSRKTHGSAGTFDIDLLPPASGIECRSGGANGDFQVVVTFAAPVSFNSAVLYGTGSVSPALASGNQIFVNLTGVTNARTITVTLLGVNDGTKTADFSVPMSVLLGDVTGNFAVSNTDVGEVKAQVNPTTPVTASDFRDDVSCNGFVTNTDVGTTKAQVGTVIP